MVKHKEQNSKGYSIKTRIVYALFALVAIQGVILICSISITGAIRKNDIATYNTLSNQTNSRKNEIQSLFNTKRRNITEVSALLSNEIEEVLSDNNITIGNLAEDDGIYDEILDLSLGELVEFTKYNPVTGVFVVLDTSPDITSKEKTSRSCMYIRDSSPGIISGNNQNLLLEYGSVNIARARGIALDSLWTADIDFSEQFNREFYFKPVIAAIDARDSTAKLQTYGYWNAPFKLRKDDISIITYSLPLILSDGTVYGVIGFDLETNYVSNVIMPDSEIPYARGSYLLGVDMGDGLYNDSVISSGAYAEQFLSGTRAKINHSFIYENEESTVHEITNANYPDNKAIGAYSQIGLYETYSPFYSEKWALICMAPEEYVMSGSNSVKESIIISIISTVLLALCLSFLVMSYIFSPIRRLSEKVRSIDPEEPVRFHRTGIREIDELSGAFEILSDGISEAAAKMFKIIELVNMPLGSFEINYREDMVQLSKSIFKLFSIELPDDGSFNIPIEKWRELIASFIENNTVYEDGTTETLYTTGSSWDKKRWFRIRMTTENMRDIGVVIDVTDEIMQKQKLEFERNYDSLTKLLNRKAFSDKAFEIIKSKPDKVGIMMFADLDDLKFVNDLYGHETGDEYITKFASFLSRFKEFGAIVGRSSGDEFVMFMAGFNSREEAKTVFDSVFAHLKDSTISTADGAIHKTRVSVGLSYYPEDSSNIKELIKYADYAMYEIKHSMKGEIQEFNINSYNKNSFVLNMKSFLNLLIDEKRIRFAFQPIIDVRSGEVYAYEALMRSMVREFKSPDEILKVARSQSKLYQIEKLTFDVVFSWIRSNMQIVEGKKIFINSIPNQIFTDCDMDEICSKYSDLFDMVVFEITENESSSVEDTKKKMELFRAFGSKVAIDDYGSGYSNELALLSIEPDFLKIDMSIVRNIDKDNDKQQLVENIILYASKRNIKTIAEGVETYEEMDMLVNLGIDYIQGYYLVKPNFEIIDISEDLKDKLTGICAKHTLRT